MPILSRSVLFVVYKSWYCLAEVNQCYHTKVTLLGRFQRSRRLPLRLATKICSQTTKLHFPNNPYLLFSPAVTQLSPRATWGIISSRISAILLSDTGTTFPSFPSSLLSCLLPSSFVSAVWPCQGV